MGRRVALSTLWCLSPVICLDIQDTAPAKTRKADRVAAGGWREDAQIMVGIAFALAETAAGLGRMFADALWRFA